MIIFQFIDCKSRHVEWRAAKNIYKDHDSISIINFIHEYNKDKKYEAILNNASTLYIDPSYDITNEIVDLLNKRYVKK